MRFRSFGRSGKVVSAISLLLRETEVGSNLAAWRATAISALENGINFFELSAQGDALPMGVAAALDTLERHLVLLGWRVHHQGRLPLTGRNLMANVQDGLRKTRAGYFDTLMLEEHAYNCLNDEGHKCLAELKTAGICTRIGIVGEGATVDRCLKVGSFDLLSTSCDMTSDAQTRRRVRDASDQDLIVIARNPIPMDLIKSSQVPLTRRIGQVLGMVPKHSLAGAGTFQFLHTTPEWTAADLCIAYLMTEPSMATVMFEADNPETIAKWASIADRDLPAGISAQVEMARFAEEDRPQRRA